MEYVADIFGALIVLAVVAIVVAVPVIVLLMAYLGVSGLHEDLKLKPLHSRTVVRLALGASLLTMSGLLFLISFKLKTGVLSGSIAGEFLSVVLFFPAVFALIFGGAHLMQSSWHLITNGLKRVYDRMGIRERKLSQYDPIVIDRSRHAFGVPKSRYFWVPEFFLRWFQSLGEENTPALCLG
jgi:hypothetical protein